MHLMNLAEKAVKTTTVDSLIYSVLGFAIVFTVLIVLMAFIGIMSKAFRSGKKTEKAEAEPVSAPVQVAAPVAAPAPAPATVPDGAMFVTLGGIKHTVSVTEKLPRFNVKLNGKTYAVDVEDVEEDAE